MVEWRRAARPASDPGPLPTRIAATLTIALADSRWTRWALPDDGRMQRLTRLHELDGGHRGVSTGGAWVTDDVTAVAVWDPPAAVRPAPAPLPADVRAALDRELPYLAADRASVVAETAALVTAARPDDPHWWLAHLGVRPTSRRQGSGRRRARPGAGALRRRGRPRRGRRLQLGERPVPPRFGFEVTTTTRTADDALPLWVLVRQPQPAVVG